VPITDRTLYLDMRHFTTFELDEEKSVVTIGGGSVTGPVLKTLAAKGWYTCTPNSNAVGMVGALLGGLNHSLVGVHGMGIDAIQSLTVLPLSTPHGEQPRALVLSDQSTGQERALFDALRGAGHGLGIVTSVTLKAYRILSLGMSDNKVWTRRLIFSPKALSVAITTYTSLITSIPAQLSAVLVFIRAPPTAPVPGAPMVMLALNYFGPSEDAERVCGMTLSEAVTSAAINATTAMSDLGTMNDAFEGLNRHGGFKEYHSAFVKGLDGSSVEKAFKAWVDFTAVDLKARGGSYLVIGASNPSASLKNAAGGSLFSARDRGVFMQVSPWYADVAEKADADAFGKTVVAAVREKDKRAALRDWSFANNFCQGQDVSTVYTEAQIESIKRVKSTWDSSSVGWSPVIDGW
jgi:hypothetical protein